MPQQLQHYSRRNIVAMTGAGMLAGLAGCLDEIDQLVGGEPEPGMADPYPIEPPQPSVITEPSDEFGGQLPVSESSGLLTYMNSEYGYSVQYPASAQVNESDSMFVSFVGEGFVQFVGILTFDTPPSLTEAVDLYTTTSSQNSEDYQVIAQRAVSLSSGQSGVVIDATKRLEGMNLREKMLAVVVGGVFYRVVIITAQETFTQELDTAANTIVESLRISA